MNKETDIMKKKYKIAAIALIVIISAAAAISFIYKEEKISVYEVGEKSVLKETVRDTGIIKSGRSACFRLHLTGLPAYMWSWEIG